MGKHFLQTEAWARFQKELGREVIEKTNDEWSYLAIVERGRFANRIYTPYGPTVSGVDALKEALADLRTEAKTRNLDFVRVEPRYDERTSVEDNYLPQLGLRKSAHDVQPTDTVINYLQHDDGTVLTADEILLQGSQSMRQMWRKLAKNEVEYEHSNNVADIGLFLNMIHAVAKRTGMNPLPDNYFTQIGKTLFEDGSAGMLLARKDNKIIASLIYYKSSDMIVYAHAAADDDYRKLSPGTGLVIRLMRLACDENVPIVDLHGIAPEGAPKTHPWSGFTHFKKSFGGTPEHFSGTWELPLHKWKYRVYRTLLKLKHE